MYVYSKVKLKEYCSLKIHFYFKSATVENFMNQKMVDIILYVNSYASLQDLNCYVTEHRYQDTELFYILVY